jgi:membrane associated rhomboid family serine protease
VPLDKVVIVVLVVQVAAPALGIGDWSSSAAHLAGLATGAAYDHLLRSRTAGGVPAARVSSR